MALATKDEARRAIVDAALDLFDRFGPVKTSMADIARQVGMSPAHIYNFFPSRDALVEAAGEVWVADLQRQIAADLAHHDDSWQRLRLLFLNTAGYLRAHLQDEKDIIHLQTLERKYQWQFLGNFHRFLRETAEATLRVGIGRGEFRPMDPAPVTGALFDCMTGALDPLTLVRTEADEHVRRLEVQLDLLERALRPASRDRDPDAAARGGGSL